MLVRSPSRAVSRLPVRGPIEAGGLPADLAVFADGTDGFLYDFSKLSKLWKDTAATTPVAAAGDGIARSDDISPRGRNATQATTAAQPKWQAGGYAQFDGSDDHLSTTLTCGPQMTLAVKVKPHLTAALGMIFLGVSTANRFALALDATTGKLGGAVGSQNQSVISGGSGIRGTTGVAFLTADSSTVNLYWNNALLYSGAQSGAIDITRGIPVGGGVVQSTGTIASFIAADIYHALAIKKALTASEIAAITNLWGTT